MVSFEQYIKWFTDLLHICDNIAHLQTELVIMFHCIVKQNHCFCCEGMCVLVVVNRGGDVDGRRKEEEGHGEYICLQVMWEE